MATKSAIGKMTKDAMNRIEVAVGLLQDQFGVDPLDLAAIRNRDPAYEHAARLVHIAEWCEDLNVKLEQFGFDLSGAQLVSENVDTIRFVLDRALNEMTIAQLKGVLADMDAEYTARTKQEHVNEIVAALTGKHIEVIRLNDEPGIYEMAEDIAETAMDLMEELEDEHFEDEDESI